MFEPQLLTIIFLTFVCAGVTKGVIGMGLPTVSLAGLTVALDLPTAMSLLLAPSLITNLWQGCRGGHLIQLCRRLWPFLLGAALMIWLGVRLSVGMDVRELSALLGLVLISYALIGLRGIVPKQVKNEQLWSPLIGLTNGVLTGLTGSFVVPGVLYLQALQLPRDVLIQAMGLLFTVSTLILALALLEHQRITNEQLWLSIAAIIPAVIGMLLGQKIRKRLSDQHFRQVFFSALLVVGLYITTTALLY